MWKKILIIGAGLAGVTCAREFADSGYLVNIIEKHNHLGGHCHDEKNELGITVHTYGPHIFHTTQKEIWDYVNRFTTFNYYQHRVLSYAEGKYYPFPINRDTLCKVFGITLPTYETSKFIDQLKENEKIKEPANYEEAVISQVGRTLYSMFFENYTKKQWGCNPKELSVEIAKRIPVRKNRDNRYFSDQYQGIPSNGYTFLIKSMLRHQNISIDLGVEYSRSINDKAYDLVVYTGELDKFFDYSEGKLEYRSLNLVFQNIKTEYYQSVATINYPNDYDWTRITEYKYFLNEKSSSTTVCFEYPAKDGEPYYIVPSKRNFELKDLYLKKVKKLEDKNSYLFIGRLAEYTYYNMDQVIAQALKKTRNWINSH